MIGQLYQSISSANDFAVQLHKPNLSDQGYKNLPKNKSKVKICFTLQEFYWNYVMSYPIICKFCQM